MSAKYDTSFYETNGLPAQVISPGKAFGVLCLADAAGPALPAGAKILETDVAGEIKRFQSIAHSVAKEIEAVVEILEKDAYQEQSEILKAHIWMLRDKQLFNKVAEKISTRHVAADVALEDAFREIVARFEGSGNSYLSERANDFKDITRRLMRRLTRKEGRVFDNIINTMENSIIAVPELLPSHLLEVRNSRVAGFVVEKGTSLSHAAIFAKSFGLPVLKVKSLHGAGLKNGMNVLLDGERGRIVFGPRGNDEKQLGKTGTKAAAAKPLPIKLQINIIDAEQVSGEILNRTDGIGLYRTEYLFMSRKDDFPSEEDQYLAYSSLFDKCKNQPVVVRTLDIGADKELPYFSLGPQENPYLGFRAHRIYRFHPEIFITQVKAILRAAKTCKDLVLLYPMIESTDDLAFVQELLQKAIDALRQGNEDHLADFRQGILVEVPSAVWSFKDLLSRVDVACLGTNDLLQYFFAIDRNNANAYGSYRPDHPVVWRVIKNMVEIAKSLHKPLSVCGEIAADPNFIPLLIGLGLDALSVDVHAVHGVKNKILSIDIGACRQLVTKVLAAKYSKEVRQLLSQFDGNTPTNSDTDFKDDVQSIDPVCKMVVHTKNNEFRIAVDGKDYYFCCKRCMDKFAQDH